MMKKILFLIIPALMAIGCNGQSNKESGNVDVETAKEMIENGEVVVIDVRTNEEYNQGHLEDAKLYNYQSDNFNAEINELDRDKAYLIYCHSGNRSSKAAAVMNDLGFKTVYNMEGGISAWKGRGNKTVQ